MPPSRTRPARGVAASEPTMTAYELAREARLAKNREVLASLAIPALDGGRETADDDADDDAAARRERRRRAKASASTSRGPTRRSDRAEARRVKSYAEEDDEDEDEDERRGSAEEESDDVEFLSSDADEDDEDDEDDEATEDDEEADPGEPADSTDLGEGNDDPLRFRRRRKKRPREAAAGADPSGVPTPGASASASASASAHASDVRAVFLELLAPSSRVAVRRGAASEAGATFGLAELRAAANAHGFPDWTDADLARMLEPATTGAGGGAGEGGGARLGLEDLKRIAMRVGARRGKA